MIDRYERLGLFYTTPTNVKYVYTDYPTGDLDVQRVIEGEQHCWRRLSSEHTLQKKKIIVSNQLTRHELIQDFQEIKVWEKLRQDGFEIIERDEDKHPNDLIKEYAQQNIASDEIYIADFSHTKIFLKKLEFETGLKELFIDKISSLSENELEKLLSSIPDHPRITLVVEKLETLHNEKIISFLQRHPSLKLSSMDINWSDLQNVLLNIPQLTHLKFQSCTGMQIPSDLKWPTALKSLDISISGDDEVCTTWEDIIRIFKQCPNLNNLNLFGNDPEDRMPNDMVWSSSLETLNLGNSFLSWQDVKNICKQCPKLKILKLHQCKELGNFPNDFQWPEELKIIFLGDEELFYPWNVLGIIQQQCKQIRKLNLRNCQLTGAFPEEMQSFKRLEFLEVANSNIEWSQIERITKDSPLKKLSVGSYDDRGEIPESLQFPELIQLEASDSTISWHDIQKITKKSNQLRRLELQDCKVLGRIPDDIRFNALEVLELSETNINWKKIRKLAKISPHLRNLQLRSCGELGRIPADINLSTLEYIDLSHTSITWEDIHCLSVNGMQPKDINLTSCRNLGDVPDNMQLLSLNSIAICRNKIRVGRVAKMLKSCPQLKLLTLQDCIISGNCADWPDDHPLRVIDFSNSKINYEQFKLILKKCKNLICVKYSNLTPKQYAEIKEEYPHINIIGQKASRRKDGKRKKIRSRKEKKERGLDSNTNPPDKPIPTIQYFKNKKNSQYPDPNDYRLDIYTHININAESVTLKKHDKKNLISHGSIEKEKQDSDVTQIYEKYYEDHPHLFLGKMELLRHSDTWVPLPSLTTLDQLRLISTIPSIDFDLAYCPEEALYYIKPKENLNQSVEVSFIIETQILPELKSESIDEELQSLISGLRFDKNGIIKNECYFAFRNLKDEEKIPSLIAFFNKFTCEDLSELPENQIDLLNLMIKERKGVCRHRVMAFMAIAQCFNLPVHAIYNDCHAYVEINYGGTWYRADLGGAPAELEIESLHEKKIEKEKSTDIKRLALAKHNPFCTWEKLKSKADDMDEYTLDLLKLTNDLIPARKNILSVMSTEQIESLHTQMLRYAHCYYLHDLDNVRMSDIEVDNSTNSYKKIDSALVRFLKQAKPGDVLMVNWSHYESNHVGFNTIMDTPRTLNGVPIPEGVIVVGVLDKTQTMSEDFHSRFQKTIISPDHLPTISCLPQPSREVNSDLTTINFFDEDWKSTLLGKLQIATNGYHYNESEFSEAIDQSKQQIVFKNAPWHLIEFRLFITEMLAKRGFEANDKFYSLPSEFQIIRDDSPFMLDISHHHVFPFQESLDFRDAYVLNNTNLNSLFSNYQCNEKQQLRQLDGLLAMNHGQILKLVVTDSLPPAIWAKILKEADKNEVTLQLIVAPQVKMPEEFPTLSVSLPQFNQGITKLICTNDVDLCVEQLQKESEKDKYRKTIVISVSEQTTFSDLCEKIKLIDHDGAKLFSHSVSVLAENLLIGNHVILKGDISPILAKQLESLFSPSPYLIVNGKESAIEKGKLTLVSRKKINTHLIPSQEIHFEQMELWDELKKYNHSDKPEILHKLCHDFCQMSKEPEFGFIQLKSMLRRMEIKPKSNPLKPFIRLRRNYHELKPIADGIWREICPKGKNAVKELDVIEKRVDKIISELENSPYLFIAGQSGIGKSYFVQEELKKRGYKIYEGMEHLETLLEPSDTPRILFIDEANLYQPGAFDIFEGLFNKPPQILINGQLHSLSPLDKIIFAGNFGNFKGRYQHEFFARHGQTIIFKEFPDSVLHERILNPIMKELCSEINETEIQEVEKIFIEIYHFVNQLFPDQHPATARNLQMMALRFALLKEKMNINDSTLFAAYDEVHKLLNPEQKKQLQLFMKDQFTVNPKMIKRELKNDLAFAKSKFHLTKNRINVVRMLNDLMRIRELKIEHSALSKKGVNGFLMEGEAGIGKSLLAISYLKSQGFVNGNNLSEDRQTPSNKKYYHLTPTDPLRMQELLLRAFHEGAVVVIDEMNTMPLEKILNSLLSGVDLEGKPAENPGFFVIATQNPVSYGKRQAMSLALLNRFQKVNLKDYTEEELFEITQQKIHDSVLAETLVEFYSEAKAYAKSKHISPEPTPRDLLKTAELLIVPKLLGLYENLHEIKKEFLRNIKQNYHLELETDSDAAMSSELSQYFKALSKLDKIEPDKEENAEEKIRKMNQLIKLYKKIMRYYEIIQNHLKLEKMEDAGEKSLGSEQSSGVIYNLFKTVPRKAEIESVARKKRKYECLMERKSDLVTSGRNKHSEDSIEQRFKRHHACPDAEKGSDLVIGQDSGKTSERQRVGKRKFERVDSSNPYIMNSPKSDAVERMFKSESLMSNTLSFLARKIERIHKNDERYQQKTKKSK